MDVGVVTVMAVAPLAMVVVLACAVAGGSGRLARNGFVGIRIPSTLASDAGWRAGHRAAVIPSAVGVAVLLVADGVAVALAATGAADTAVVLVPLVPLVAAIAVVVVAASRGARRADG